MSNPDTRCTPSVNPTITDGADTEAASSPLFVVGNTATATSAPGLKRNIHHMSLEETSAPETYELHFTVQPGDIDMLGHVNNIVYLRWVQDIAIAHWGARAPQEDQDALYWVVTRHEIDYKRSAMPGDTIRAKTWIGKASRFAFERHTEILRASDGKLLVKALTLWCPMSRATNKPVDVRPEVRTLFSVGMLDEVSPAAATGR